MLCTAAINTSNTTRTQTGAERTLKQHLVSYRITDTRTLADHGTAGRILYFAKRSMRPY